MAAGPGAAVAWAPIIVAEAILTEGTVVVALACPARANGVIAESLLITVPNVVAVLRVRAWICVIGSRWRPAALGWRLIETAPLIRLTSVLTVASVALRTRVLLTARPGDAAAAFTGLVGGAGLLLIAGTAALSPDRDAQ